MVGRVQSNISAVCRQRGGWMCEIESHRGRKESMKPYEEAVIFFSLSETQEILLAGQYPSNYPPHILHCDYIGDTFHTETQVNIPQIYTRGNEIQLWQFASCPTENSHRQIHFELHHLFTVCTPLRSMACYCEILSPQPMVIYKAHLYLCFTLFHLCCHI